MTGGDVFSFGIKECDEGVSLLVMSGGWGGTSVGRRILAAGGCLWRWRREMDRLIMPTPMLDQFLCCTVSDVCGRLFLKKRFCLAYRFCSGKNEKAENETMGN